MNAHFFCCMLLKCAVMLQLPWTFQSWFKALTMLLWHPTLSAQQRLVRGHCQRLQLPLNPKGSFRRVMSCMTSTQTGMAINQP